jgi:Putative amidoligase enzyme
MRLFSPKFHVVPGSSWREIVHGMWKYLSDNYHITGDQRDDHCDTHIWISLEPDFNIQQVKRIAQAVINFEPAYDALVPARNGNRNARSLWLHNDRFAACHLTRRDCIDYIQPYPHIEDMGWVMHTYELHNNDFSWNFRYLEADGGEIEFRKPPLSTEAQHCLAWAEFTMAFILACIRYPSHLALQRVPPNIKGLRWFLAQHNVTGLNESPLMQRIWRDIPLEAMVDPVICLHRGINEEDIPSETEALQEIIDRDRVWRHDLARSAREPYY